MSCYEWERGTIYLPSRDYAAFRKKIIQAWNSRQLELLSAASSALPVIKKACARKKDWEAEDAAYKAALSFWKNPQELLSLIMKREGAKLVFRSPKKKDIGLKPVSRGCVLYLDGASISFGEESASVTWSVEENNHACEDAHSHPIARLLFKELNAINWVRGTGGTIVGNDEYNRDSSYEGGGGNYVTCRFGPLGKSSYDKMA